MTLLLAATAAFVAPVVVLIGVGLVSVCRRRHREEYPAQRDWLGCHEVPDDYWSSR
jgi:hypothetical protein